MATNNSSATAKTHVSLRLPTYLLEAIDAHAEKENISRTEAFVFYLQTGLDIADNKAEEPTKDQALLQSIQDDVTVIKALLSTQGFAVPAVSSTPELTDAAAVEDEFDTSDAVMETEQPIENAYSQAERAESEEEAESDFSGSDAVIEETFGGPLDEEASEPEAGTEAEAFDNTDEEVFEEAADYSTSDAVYEESIAEESDDENPEVFEPIDDFDASDAVSEDDLSAEVTFMAEEEGEESEGSEDTENALSAKKLEKAVAKAAKQIDSIEKVWVYGPAADEKDIVATVIDLCVKAADDKIKAKHLEAFISAVEEKTGKTVSVVLKHDVSEDAKQALKNKVEIYKN